MKIQGIYMTRNIANPEQMIPEMEGKPINFDGKIVGKILSAKLDRDGNLVYEGIITDKTMKQDLYKNANYGLKILGEG